jgi:hypothetical protein
MNDKKHIDRLFQEKLKDFEATPSNAVWENISAELNAEKKDRKIIPLWIKLSGIAAVLLLMFTIGNAVFNSSDENPNTNTVVDTDNNANSNTNEINPTDKQDDLINKDKNRLEQEKLASENNTANSNDELKNQDAEANKLINNNETLSDAIVSNTSDKKSKSTTNPLKDKSTVKNLVKDASADAVVQQNVAEKTNSEITNASVNKEAVDTAINKNNTSENAVSKTTTDSNNTNGNTVEIAKEEEVIVKEEQKIAIEEALAENTLQDDVNDEKKKRNKIEDRWKVSPSIAPVYFNTLGAGSSIHEQFNQNSKTGDVNMSYGVRGSYALNDKLSVRAGVNKLTLGYSTDDVFVLKNVTATPTDSRLQLRNVDLKEEAEVISFVSVEGFALAQIPSVISSQIIGSIDQKLGFVEVPLELEYEISDQKLGLRVLGGVSALFLNENEVYSTLDGETTLIGRATNINKTSFSANLGVGLDFKLSEKFKLNLEPTFKYQLNTFSNTSGDFKPYFIGIYSGISFKF